MVRFDKPCVVVKGAVDYFREHMAVGDYLTQEGRAEMTWMGAGAERLGLAGCCQLEHFENLCRGLHPVTGEKLMIRDKGPHRRVCFFGQVSPPKDVSLLYLVGGDQRIGGWWQEAVKDTLREMEATTATRVRRGGANSDRTTGNMVAAIVTHDASRSLDPQLHTHVCIMNLTYDEAEARWKGVQPSAYYRHQGYFREVCYNKLAQRMLGAGYTVEAVRGLGFNLKGVPAELRERFSKRRRTILERAKAVGATTQDALHAITGESREAKTHATAVDLRKGWLKEAGAELPQLRATVAAAAGRPSPSTPVAPLDAVLSAEAHVFERKSVVDDRLLLREALIAGRAQVTLEGLKRALASRERSGELLRADGEIASRAGLAAEAEFTGWANGQLKRRAALGKVPGGVKLAADQAAAVRDILGSFSGVVMLQGDAGTGKTTCLKTVVAGIEKAGGRVFGCAPSSGATEVLRQELTADADTLQQLLVSEALQRSTRGRVLLVDEAGLVSVREMRELCRLAARNDNRLLLVGDIKQHSSVEAGDALRCLQEFARVPVFQLTEIRRQVDPAYRKAVARLARGDAFGAFNLFNQLGAVREVRDLPAMFAAAADDYVRTVRSGKSCLAISPVWSEIHQFTDEVRRQLRAAALIARDERTYVTVDSLKWTQEERRRVVNYQPGDVLSFHRAYGAFSKYDTVTVVRREDRFLVVREADGNERQIDPRRASGFNVGLAKETPVAVGDRLLLRANLKPVGVRNGDLVEVAGFASDGGIVLKDGRSLPDWFREFSHGYAATSHASQGKTVDRGILLMADAGITGGNLKQAYVSNSRFRESQMIFTSDKEAARDAMMRPADRKLALEMTGPDPEAAPSPRRSWRARWAARIAPLLLAAAA
ncbi:MAG: conjugative relaxase [Pedosphaera sp.]|nr:conjugative relaxase [Pedosphaera sp.]